MASRPVLTEAEWRRARHERHGEPKDDGVRHQLPHGDLELAALALGRECFPPWDEAFGAAAAAAAAATATADGEDASYHDDGPCGYTTADGSIEESIELLSALRARAHIGGGGEEDDEAPGTRTPPPRGAASLLEGVSPIRDVDDDARSAGDDGLHRLLVLRGDEGDGSGGEGQLGRDEEEARFDLLSQHASFTTPPRARGSWGAQAPTPECDDLAPHRCPAGACDQLAFISGSPYVTPERRAAPARGAAARADDGACCVCASPAAAALTASSSRPAAAGASLSRWDGDEGGDDDAEPAHGAGARDAADRRRQRQQPALQPAAAAAGGGGGLLNRHAQDVWTLSPLLSPFSALVQHLEGGPGRACESSPPPPWPPGGGGDSAAPTVHGPAACTVSPPPGPADAASQSYDGAADHDAVRSRARAFATAIDRELTSAAGGKDALLQPISTALS